jgi:hypothetical protein
MHKLKYLLLLSSVRVRRGEIGMEELAEALRQFRQRISFLRTC